MRLVTGDATLSKELLPRLIFNFETMIKTNFDASRGLYYNTDNRDGMEISISGNGGRKAFRPTLNSYQYGEAVAISKIAGSMGQDDVADRFRDIASKLRDSIDKNLWDPISKFYKVLPILPKKTATATAAAAAVVSGFAVASLGASGSSLDAITETAPLFDVRELIGYTPWYFHIPTDSDKLEAWLEVSNPKGFAAQKGLTTAEQRHPQFSLEYDWLTVGKRGSHECKWNGPVWPMATSMTLTALANMLNTVEGEKQRFVSKGDYYRILRIYALSHRRRVTQVSAAGVEVN